MVSLLLAAALSQSPQIDESMMSQCFARYKKFELPLPDRKEKFVVIHNYHEAPNIGFSVLADDGFRGPHVQVGFAEVTAMYEESKPTEELIESASLVYDRSTVRQPTGISDAMALYDRGYKKLATRLMQRAIDSPPTGTFGDFPRGTSPLVAIAYMAYACEIQGLPYLIDFQFEGDDKKEFRTSIAKLFDVEKDLGFQKKRAILDEIDLTFAQKERDDRTDESAIDTLVRSKSVFFPRPARLHSVRGYPIDDSSLAQPDGYYMRAARHGVLSAPTLINHLDDHRITQAIQIADDGSIEYCTVGQMCRRMLNALMDTDQPQTKFDYEKWFFQLHTLKPGGVYLDTDNTRYAWTKLTAEDGKFNEELLLQLREERLPDLPRFYLKSDRDVPVPLVNRMVDGIAMMEQKPSPETIAALSELAADANFHNSYLGLQALQAMRGSDTSDADTALLSAIKRLNSFVLDPAKPDDLSDIADAVCRSSDPAVWDALTDVCWKQIPQMRALLIYKASTARNGWRDETQYPLFASHFFDDTTPIPNIEPMYGWVLNESPKCFTPKTIGELAVHCAAIVKGYSYPLEQNRPGLIADLKARLLKDIG